jgi:hypothetical protein
MRFDLRATSAQRAAMLTDAGCEIVFAGLSAISATYALDPVTLDQIRAVASDASNGLGLPLDAETFTYPDKSGTPRTFTSDQLQALYKALRDYITRLTYYAVGRLPDPPTLPVTIS